jgi:hypothetical protein
MSNYVSHEALLADLRLRMDGSPPNVGLLIVEGPDDKRIFIRHAHAPALIVPAGGRRTLLKAYESADEQDRAKLLFLTDCDYEVRRGSLRANGRQGLVITEKTDVESDLIDLGLLEPVVADIVAAALNPARAEQIVDRCLGEATQFALPLGRARMAAQPLGVALHLGDINFSRHWDNKNQTVDVEKLMRTIYARLGEIGVSLDDWLKLVDETPDDLDMCHGKDLVRAFYWSLKQRHTLPADISPLAIQRLMRFSLWKRDLERWSVGRRIREWEEATGRRILL